MRPSKEFIKKVQISNLSEVIARMREGDWFCAPGMDLYDWYYRIEQMPITNMNGERGYLVRRANMSSSRSFRRYYWFVEDPNGVEVFIGDGLKTFLERQIKMWIKQMNVGSMTAFSGKRFASFLNAIPREVLQEDDFGQRLIQTIYTEIDKRINRETDPAVKDKLDFCKGVSAMVVREKSKDINAKPSAIKVFTEIVKR